MPLPENSARAQDSSYLPASEAEWQRLEKLPYITGAEEEEIPGFFLRFGAASLDSLILLLLHLPVYYAKVVVAIVLQKAGTEGTIMLMKLSGHMDFIALLAGLIAGFFYYGWFNSHYGASLGKRFFGLRLQTASGKNLNYGQSFLREGPYKLFSYLSFGSGFLLMIVRDDKKALHDILAGTKVCYAQSFSSTAPEKAPSPIVDKTLPSTQ